MDRIMRDRIVFKVPDTEPIKNKTTTIGVRRETYYKIKAVADKTGAPLITITEALLEFALGHVEYVNANPLKEYDEVE